MSERTDIIVDPLDDNDLVVYQGDFFVESSDLQHLAHILEADTGQYKQWPLVGVGIRRYLNGIIDGKVRRTIQLQAASDGYKTRQVSYENGILDIGI
jgi:hypothetical protein